MRAELLSGLLAVARGGTSQKPAVTPVTPVTALSGYRLKTAELQALHALQVKNSRLENGVFQPVTEPETDPHESVLDAIEERNALCVGLPAVYLDAWARLNHLRPMGVSEVEWHRAVDDAGRFLDAWAADAAEWNWSVGDLFDLPGEDRRGGLFWFIAGKQVEAFAPDHARLSDGRVFDRGRDLGERRSD